VLLRSRHVLHHVRDSDGRDAILGDAEVNMPDSAEKEAHNIGEEIYKLFRS
jgi:hypothetical protein